MMRYWNMLTPEGKAITAVIILIVEAFLLWG